MKNAFWLFLVSAGFTLAGIATGQPALAAGAAGTTLEAPTNNWLMLPNVTGELRVLDTNGLVLESNFVYLPRIHVTDLSDGELHALLETRTAYDALTKFGPVTATNAQSAVIEGQLQQIWVQGHSLAEKIQTRLQILNDMHAYNTDVALLPGTVNFANQAAAYAGAANDRLAQKSDLTAAAASRVDNAEEARAYGNDPAGGTVHDAREGYREEAERLERADNRAQIAASQLAAANQQVMDYENKCAEISARLAARGISVPHSPPFYPIPPLSMRSEVDAERAAN